MMPMERSLPQFVLHAGLTKSGSTTLQDTVFRHHPEIHYLGKSLHFPTERHCIGAEVEALLNPLLWEWAGPIDVEALRTAARRLIFEPAAGRTIVGSWEGRASVPEWQFALMLDRVAAVFGPFRLILTLRNPLTRAVSSYLEHLRVNYSEPHYSMPKGRTWIDVDTWMRGQKERPHYLHLTVYGAHLRAAVERLGRENVAVLLFEELSADPRAFADRLSAFLGIDCAGTQSLLLEQTRNEGMSAAQLDHLRRTDASALRRLAWRLRPPVQRAAALSAIDPARSSGKACVRLEPHQSAFLAEQTAESNRWIAATFDLDLARYGYPL